MKKLMLSGGLLMLSALSCGATPSIPTATPNPFPGSPLVVCPQVSEVIKNTAKGNWTANTNAGFWQTYHSSFSNHLTRFYGAQWLGAKLGQLTCIYGSNQQFNMNGQQVIQKTFPVRLVYHALVHEPKNLAKWTHVKTGVFNCVSLQQSDCPFYVNVKPKEGDIYEEAEKLKSENSSAPSPLTTD